MRIPRPLLQPRLLASRTRAQLSLLPLRRVAEEGGSVVPCCLAEDEGVGADEGVGDGC